MHKACIFLIKGKSKNKAIKDVMEFVYQQANSIGIDWFVVGGRWSGMFSEHLKEIANSLKFINDKNLPKPFDIKTLGIKERDTYQELGYPDDVMEYKYVKQLVEKWSDTKGVIKEKEMLKSKFTNDKDMVKWINSTIKNLKRGIFCHDSSVYNITKEGNILPDTKEENKYLCVLIDFHC